MPDEMLGEFIHEASEHLATGAALILALAKTPQVDPEQVNACFRSLHTVKGCAGFLDLHRIKGLAHAGEQVLDALRSGSLTGTQATWDILLATVTRLEELIQALEATQQEPVGNDHDVIAALEAILIAPAPDSSGGVAVLKASSPSGPVDTAPSLDACIAAIIACGGNELAAIHQQIARIEQLAQLEAWSGERQQALFGLLQAAAHLDDGGDTALAVLYVQVQALQDQCNREDCAIQSRQRDEALPTTARLATPAIEGQPIGLLEDFISESLELLATAEKTVLDRSEFDADQVNAVFRSFHSIKGMAAYLQQPDIEHEAHAIEDALLPVRDGAAPADTGFVQRVLTGVDLLRGRLAALRNPQASAETPPEEVPRLGDLLVDLGVARDVIEETAKHLKSDERLGDKLVESGKVSRQVVDKAVQQQNLARGGDGYSRVATSKLEEMVNMVGELLIAQAMVVHDPELARFPNLASAVQRQSRIMRNLQVLSLSLRMVPLRATFQKMARAVHDTARKLGKSIDYSTAGEDTEIDRTLAEAMADPLMHMVRNAVDHGVESGETRSKAGKPATGNVRLEAYHAGDDVVIQLTDDGAGMDPQRLCRKAVEKGLIPADRQMTDQECFDLVFLPGFSTAAQVTDVSGRGVGMDVVRRQVRNANGQVHIQSKLGAGTVFTIRLPLTTAIMDCMLLGCGDERFLIPIASVVSMLRPAAGQVESVLTHGRVLNNRGRELPVITLGGFFGIDGHQTDPTQSLLLVIENRGKDFALQVDEVLGQRQVVIKPFDHALAHHPGVSGSAILGDGRVALILHPARLLGGAASDDAN